MLLHVCEQDEENPNLFTFAAHDDNGYLNSGLVCLSDGAIHYLCHNPEQANRDALEGIDEDDSKQWWNAHDKETFLLFLTGEVREIVGRFRKIALDSER